MRRALYFVPLLGLLVVAGTGAQISPEHRAAPGASADATQLIEQVSGTSLGLVAGSFEHATLTVSGPNGYRAVQDFEATDIVSIDLLAQGRRVIENEVNESVVRLDDGRYRYELVTVDSSGKASKSTGVFIATGGAALSRDLFRSGLSELRQQLVEDEQNETDSSSNAGDLHTKVSASYSTDRFVAIDDSGTGTTSLYLDSDSPTPAQLWAIDNVLGDLNIRALFSGVSSRLFIDRSNNHIGFGTTTPNGSLHVTDSSFPELILENAGSTRWEIQAGPSELSFFEGSLEEMFSIENGGRTNQLVLDSEGGIGIGTDDPSATLEIEDTAGDAQFLIDQRGADAAVEVMFNLVCNCAPAFRMQSSINGKVWFFRHTAGGNFAFDDPASAGLEMLLQSNGNLTLKGSLSQGSSRALKENLKQPDSAAILSTLDDLDLYEWSYKHATARHFGPMAEDFAEAFGLGEQRTRLAPADVAGVALAATKALRRENLELKEGNDGLLQELGALRQDHEELKVQLRLLAQTVQQLQDQ